MKVACPSCSRPLNLPDQFAGKTSKCPACQKSFTVPELTDKDGQPIVITSVPIVPEDKLALANMVDKNPDALNGAPDPTQIEICPSCGKLWKKGQKECKKCHYNVIAGMKLAAPRKKRLADVANLDVSSLVTYAIVAVIGYGLYWLYCNANDITRKGHEAYDNATRTTPTDEDNSAMTRKDSKK